MSGGRYALPAGTATAVARRTGGRLLVALAGVAATVLVVGMPAGSAGAAGAAGHSVGVGSVGKVIASSADRALAVGGRRRLTWRFPTRGLPRQAGPDCTFNGNPDVVENVTPGEGISLHCMGWLANDPIAATEFSPLFFQTGSDNEIDPNLQYFAVGRRRHDLRHHHRSRPVHRPRSRCRLSADPRAGRAGFPRMRPRDRRPQRQRGPRGAGVRRPGAPTPTARRGGRRDRSGTRRRRILDRMGQRHRDLPRRCRRVR